MTFKVDRAPAVDQQIRDLDERAKARRIRDAYRFALKTMLDHLTEHALEWGDPDYHTKLPGGLVCHGIVWPLCVRYAVYETLGVVIIFDIAPLPHSPLAVS